MNRVYLLHVSATHGLLKEVRHKVFYVRVLNRVFLKLSILHLCGSQTSVISRRISLSLGIPLRMAT